MQHPERTSKGGGFPSIALQCMLNGKRVSLFSFSFNFLVKFCFCFLELEKLVRDGKLVAKRLHKFKQVFEVKYGSGSRWTSLKYPSDMPLSLLEATGPWRVPSMRRYVATIKAAQEFERSGDSTASAPKYPCRH